MSKPAPVLKTVSSQNVPVLSHGVKTNKPRVQYDVRKKKWSFSFQYFKQQEDYFGLEGVDGKWFVSLLNRLQNLSEQPIDNILQNQSERSAYRFHKIDWNARNIPLRRDQFDWIDKQILENEDEYPFFQFQVSTGLGRVIGFWHESHDFFYVVLLDYHHNLQPSRRYNYRVVNTTQGYCELTGLLADLDAVKSTSCPVGDCKCKERLYSLPKIIEHRQITMMYLEESYLSKFEQHIQAGQSLQDIFELGILALEG